MNTFVALVVAICAIIAGGCQPPDCDRVDFGSCGNACCRMEYHFAIPVDELLIDVQSVFDSQNGPDGRYVPQPMADGSLGFSDLTPYNLSVQYMGQVGHYTETKHYNDTVNMNFAKNKKGGSTLNIFSISQIGGAYSDSGQNYKNIIQIVKALGNPYTEEVSIMGCSKPKDQ